MATTSKSRRKTVQAIVTVTKFTDSSRPFTVVRPQSELKEYVPLHGGDYQAKGWDTPLRDATAKFIAHLEALQSPDRVVIGLMADESGSMGGNEGAVIQGINDFVAGMAKVKKVDPKTAGNVLAVITTDGIENASREVSTETLVNLIASKEKEGWTFIFLGAQIDAWAAGGSLGFSGGVTGQMVSTQPGPAGMSAGIAYAAADSVDYLEDISNYQVAKASSGTTRSSVNAAGQVFTTNINAPGTTIMSTGGPFSSPYADVAEALKKTGLGTPDKKDE